MNNNKFEKMMHSYTNREVEPFELKEKRSSLKFTSVLAATLVLAIIASVLLIPSANTENDFTLTVSAAELPFGNELSVNQTEIDYYNSVGQYLGHQEKNQVVIGIDGENIEDVSMKSENGFNQFFFIDGEVANCYSPDGKIDNNDGVNFKDYANMIPDADAPYDASVFVDNDGMVSSDPTVEEIQYYLRINEAVNTNNKAFDSDLCLICTAIDENGYYLTEEKFCSKYDDIIDVTVTFTDGTTLTKCVSISYEDYTVNAKEISAK